MHRIVLGHINHVIQTDKGIIDAYDLDFRVFSSSTQHQPANAAKTIDAYLNCHTSFLLNVIKLINSMHSPR